MVSGSRLVLIFYMLIILDMRIQVVGQLLEFQAAIDPFLPIKIGPLPFAVAVYLRH